MRQNEKSGQIDDNANAAGLAEARECLRVDTLSDADRQAYYRHMESVRHMKSLFDTSRDEGYEEERAEGRKEGRKERSLEIARQLKAMGMSKEQIALATGLHLDEI